MMTTKVVFLCGSTWAFLVCVKVCPITVPLRVFTRREGERKDREKAR